MRRRRQQADAERALLDRLDRLERRVEDIEDTVAAALRVDRYDDLVERIDDLAMTSTTHDDLLGVRMHAARLAAELTRLVTELRADHAGLRTALAEHVHAHGRSEAAAG